MPGNSIFLGVTTAPCRDFVGRLALDYKPSRIYMPYAGRFSAVEATLKHGANPGQLLTSDIGLFSTLIGYLASGQKLGDLGLHVHYSEEWNTDPGLGVVADALSSGDLEFAAEILLLMKYGQFKPTNEHSLNIRRELRKRWVYYRSTVRQSLEILVNALRGISYEVKDVWKVIEEAADDENAAIFLNVPAYKGGYTKMFANTAVTWKQPDIPEYDHTMFPQLLEKLQHAKCHALVYVQKSLKVLNAVDQHAWRVVFAESHDVDRIDCVISNRRPQNVHAVQRTEAKKVKIFPIFEDQDITPESKISFAKVDKDTCLYYRDLFVHKLGTTSAEIYYLMLIDGRVVTALGLNTQFIRKFQSDYVYEVYGISKSSKRYQRLSKIVMMAITSGSFKELLIRELNLGVHDPRGIQTSSITTFAEGKTDRGILKIVSRRRRSDGRFHIIYRGDFRPDTWSDVMATWHKRFAAYKRLQGMTRESVAERVGSRQLGAVNPATHPTADESGRRTEKKLTLEQIDALPQE